METNSKNWRKKMNEFNDTGIVNFFEKIGNILGTAVPNPFGLSIALGIILVAYVVTMVKHDSSVKHIAALIIGITGLFFALMPVVTHLYTTKGFGTAGLVGIPGLCLLLGMILIVLDEDRRPLVGICLAGVVFFSGISMMNLN